jgi:hydroxyacylglutathione hydrolase
MGSPDLGIRIDPIPAFSDNYIWLIQQHGAACLVDPGDASPAMAYLQQRGLRLTAILLTHKHGDHTGGVLELVGHYPEVAVYGPSDERADGVDHPMQDRDEINLPGIDLTFQVLAVPGHTVGHLAFYAPGILFCGDTLFSVGCGRLFGGSFEQLHHSLQLLAQLPAETHCYCAHEYTLDNIGFAKWVEPENPALRQREHDCQQLREQGEPTLPSLLSQELACNPFLRTEKNDVVMAAERYAGRSLSGPAEVFRALRQWKDKEYD